ncbi:MAG: hypothetical protein GY828_04605, partial [Candidatus Gracilibacteria bacterium]|nr:hypothetical protein [Candidatus Gracilibacteria bacterium]
GSVVFTVDTLNHQVREGSHVIIGGNSYGHTFEQGDLGTNILLNNPTGIALGEGGFFLSDTLNHRILFYKNGTVSLILDSSDGINEPTGLAYDPNTHTLYISNSGKAEILSVSSDVQTVNPVPVLVFTPKENLSNVTRFTLGFPEVSEAIGVPFGTGSFSFQGPLNQFEDYLEIEDNILSYYFTDYPDTTPLSEDIFIPSCSDEINIEINNSIPEKTETICNSNSQTGSIYLHGGITAQSLNTSLDYQIQIDELTPYLSGAQTYTMELEFFNTETSLYRERFKYFTQGDGSIHNRENLIYSTFASDLGYPTGLEISGSNLMVNDFIDRKQYTYNLSTSLRTESNLTPFSASGFSQFDISDLTDTMLQNPIADFSVSYDNIEKYFTSKIQYYQYINCYNLDENVKKTFIFHKNLK